jgi:hypothetical protein
MIITIDYEIIKDVNNLLIRVCCFMMFYITYSFKFEV